MHSALCTVHTVQIPETCFTKSIIRLCGHTCHFLWSNIPLQKWGQINIRNSLFCKLHVCYCKLNAPCSHSTISHLLTQVNRYSSTCPRTSRPRTVCSTDFVLSTLTHILTLTKLSVMEKDGTGAKFLGHNADVLPQKSEHRVPEPCSSEILSQ